MRRIGLAAAAALATLGAVPTNSIALTTTEQQAPRPTDNPLLDAFLGLGRRFPFNPYRPHYGKHGPTVAQAKRAAIKAKNRAKHRAHCRGHA